MANLIKVWPTLKRLLRYTSFERKTILFGIFILLISSVSEILGPILISKFINNVLIKNNFNKKYMFFILCTFIILQYISIFLNYIQTLLFSKTAIKIIQKLRIEVMESVLKQPLNFFHIQPTGKIVSIVTNDTEIIKELYHTSLMTIFRNITLIIIMLISMFILKWEMALITFTLIPSILIIILIYQYYSTPIIRNVRSYLAKINHEFNEVINGMPVIKQFLQELKFKQLIYHTSKLHYLKRMEALKLDGILLRPLISFLSTIILCGLITLFSLSYMTCNTIGILYAFINYLNRLNEPLITIATQQSILQQSIVAGERIFKLIDSHQQEYGKDIIPLQTGEIKISNLNFSHQKNSHNTLNNINLHIPSKSFVALVGPTGSGKSTLANLIMGHFQTEKGEIFLDKREIHTLSYKTLKNGIHMLQQEPMIFQGTILSNICLGKNISEEKIWTILKIVQLEKLIKSLPKKLYTELKENGKNLSAGEKQLLSIARILISKPKILILDEATSNIDSETEKLIQKTLLSIRKKYTLIIIAHRLSTIVEADKIIVLKKGQISEKGKHDELIQKRGIYYDMYYERQ
ncbi:SmdB family multidrug efflux ABC transporter permease/ATP-binding protein [Buchnera aphidicola]|uniref:SmdB family multidrug efflux ABC transporter permease/ATP-binding protein n=1 Tax=Buchnera aphidicola TaxID=9 RepID=UPI0034649C04